jgi:hypothetical protein
VRGAQPRREPARPLLSGKAEAFIQQRLRSVSRLGIGRQDLGVDAQDLRAVRVARQ